MKPEPQESGLEELMRLSRQFTRQKEEDVQREKKRQEQKKKVQDVLGGLKGLTVSMAVEQLKMVAAPGIVKKIDALKSRPGTAELRQLITDLAYDLEKSIGALDLSNPEIESIERSMKTLTILIELFFALQ